MAITPNVKNVDLGVFAEVNFINVSIQPGLLYTLKGGGGGYSMDMTTNGFTETYTEVHIKYLELPINVLYNVRLKPGKIFFGGGPYAGYALSAKSKNYTTTYNSYGLFISMDKYDVDGTFGSGPDDLPRFNYGLNALAGFRFTNGFEANVGYVWG